MKCAILIGMNTPLSSSTKSTIEVALYLRANALLVDLRELFDNEYTSDALFAHLADSYYETVAAATEFCGPYCITKPAVIG